jgi:hypothetical protein
MAGELWGLLWTSLAVHQTLGFIIWGIYVAIIITAILIFLWGYVVVRQAEVMIIERTSFCCFVGHSNPQ